jgi:uncharacterized protein (AIM24 family)
MVKRSGSISLERELKGGIISEIKRGVTGEGIFLTPKTVTVP